MTMGEVAETVEVVEKQEDGIGCDIRLEVSPVPQKKLETNSNNIAGLPQTELSPNRRECPDPKKTSVSPNSRRVLPIPPTCPSPNSELNTSQDDNDTEKLMRKFRYDTIARKKKEKKQQRNSSTFYLISSVHSEPNITSLTTSEPNLSLRPHSPSCESQKSPRLNFSPSFIKKKSESPLSRKKDSPLSNSHTLKKKIGKANSLHTTEKQTHVALYKFLPRHKDELAFTEGDPIHVNKIHDDLWYEGINISTGKQGVFPCRYVADIMADELDCSIDDPSDHKQFHVRFLGSVEVQDHKGDEILLYAIARVVNQRSMLSSANPPTCVLQVSSSGVRICNMVYGTKPAQHHETEKKNKKGKNTDPTSGNESAAEESHYFSLKNVTFCGNHPKDKRYFGFITKHPDEYRFACHVMMSKYSTDPIAKIFGQCFEKFYTNFMEYRASTEDIYLE